MSNNETNKMSNNENNQNNDPPDYLEDRIKTLEAEIEQLKKNNWSMLRVLKKTYGLINDRMDIQETIMEELVNKLEPTRNN